MAFSLMVLGCVSPPKREALAADTLEGDFGAHRVSDAQLGAVVHAEVELREIALQVRFAAMLVGADHAALEHREEAFQRVRVRPPRDWPGHRPKLHGWAATPWRA
jgi:hypothetical protein